MRKSSSALILAILLWTSGVIFIPVASNCGVSLLQELFQADEIIETKQATAREIESFIQRNFYPPDFDDSDLSNFSGISTSQSPWLYDGTPSIIRLFEHHVRMIEPLWRKRAEVLRALGQRHDEAMLRQQRLANWLGILAPATHLRNAFTALAGTNAHANLDFIEFSRRYRSNLLSTFDARGFFSRNALAFFSHLTKEQAYSWEDYERRWAANVDKQNSGKVSLGDFINPDNWGRPPKELVPDIKVPVSQSQFGLAFQSLAALLLTCALLYLAGYLAFARYDVR